MGRSSQCGPTRRLNQETHYMGAKHLIDTIRGILETAKYPICANT